MQTGQNFIILSAEFIQTHLTLETKIMFLQKKWVWSFENFNEEN